LFGLANRLIGDVENRDVSVSAIHETIDEKRSTTANVNDGSVGIYHAIRDQSQRQGWLGLIPTQSFIGL